MVDAHPFSGEPATTREAIMQATFRALREHGYAGLTIQRIGDHFEKSKSLLYHHYDSKDELLLEFLAYMLAEFEQAAPDDDLPPRERLDAILDHVLAVKLPDDQRDFTRAMVELRAQAAHDDRYRDHFTRSDDSLHDEVASIVGEGVDAGKFRDVDPDNVASFLLTLVNGAMTQRVTAEETHTEAVREEVDAYLQSRLLADE
ncbi:TetR/AcrR family transcriptional regulator [Halobacterium noricense]|uniref:TetR/AcrR family transcriptional regulator n=1 Tax=Halobacterium noricense TaxID=223182 RepID=UPI001E4E7F30|nr:TetR/AcrR family transcriptional regulator [Halobacterium noricense]UHH26383.1 TetR family transcriptional regulator [Halobacterium noricense]